MEVFGFIGWILIYLVIGVVSALATWGFVSENFGSRREDVLFGEIMFWPISLPILIGLIIHSLFNKKNDND